MPPSASAIGRRALALETLGVLLVPGPRPACAEPGPAPGLRRHLETSPQLLDDPGGVRTRLERLGIVPQLFYQEFVSWKPAGGGVDTSPAFGHSGSYDLFGLVDAEELAGWPGLDLLVHAKGIYDRSVNDEVGALSDPIDDADPDVPIYFEQIWLEQAVLRDRLRARVGMLSQQTLFDRNAYANSEDMQFLTTFLDNDAVVPLPRGLGAALLASPLEWLDVAVSAVDADNDSTHAGFDTAFDGLDSLTGHLELRLRTRLQGRAGELPGSWRVGAFLDGRDRAVFGRTQPGTGLPKTERGHPGAYLSADQLAFRERPGSDQGLGLFARFGWADPDSNRIAWFWSLGARYLGLVPGRDADVVGLGIYQAIASSRYRDAQNPDFRRETGIELYYRIAALPWLALTPDLQVIVNPGGDPATDDAVVATLRVRVSF
jgi:porin